MQEVIIPSEFKVGFNKRKDTYTGKLGYMIYANKSDGTFGQQKSFDSWIDKSMGEEIIKNDYIQGFVVNRGRLNHNHFGSSAKFRVFHPHGFEFEISLENLSMLITYVNIIASEIDVPCRIGWIGQKCVLIPKIDLSKEIKIVEKNIAKEAIFIQEKKMENLEKKNGNNLALNLWLEDKVIEDNKGRRYLISKKNIKNQKETAIIVVAEKNSEKKFYNMSEPLSYGNNSYDKKRFLLPLFKANSEKALKKNIGNFIKFVEQESLTQKEKEYIAHYKKAFTIIFENEIELKNLENIENFKSLFSRKRTHVDSDINTYGNCVKINNIIYLVTTYNSKYSDYGFKQERPKRIYLNDKFNGGYSSPKCIYLFPLMSLDNEHLESKHIQCYIQNPVADNNHDFQLSSDVWSELFEVFKKEVNTLSKDELDLVKNSLVMSTDF